LLRQRNWLIYSEYINQLTFSYEQFGQQLRRFFHMNPAMGMSGQIYEGKQGQLAHHCKEQSSIPMLSSALYPCMALSGCTSSSDSESEPNL